MTNYNERLEEILDNHATSYVRQAIKVIRDGTDTNTITKLNGTDTQSKQAITSLIKELVAEAKPAEKDQLAQSTNEDESRCRFYRYGGYNFAINQFEQNLLKALEEV